MKSMLSLVLPLFGALYANAEVAVPSMKICDFEGCPVVSRMGMGTLHLGDKISGISDPQEINAWIHEALSLGITLFDMAVSDEMMWLIQFFLTTISYFRMFTLSRVAQKVIQSNCLVKLLL